MESILTDPKDALIRQYKRIFELENTELSVSSETCQIIAREAMKRKVGARALRSVVESLMLNMIFCSGQIALVPETMELKGDDIETQTRQVMKNIRENNADIKKPFISVILPVRTRSGLTGEKAMAVTANSRSSLPWPTSLGC